MSNLLCNDLEYWIISFPLKIQNLKENTYKLCSKVLQIHNSYKCRYPPPLNERERSKSQNMSRPTKITSMTVKDIRFPTSLQKDGSDAMVSELQKVHSNVYEKITVNYKKLVEFSIACWIDHYRLYNLVSQVLHLV